MLQATVAEYPMDNLLIPLHPPQIGGTCQADIHKMQQNSGQMWGLVDQPMYFSNES
jgi:hypothetical protein